MARTSRCRGWVSRVSRVGVEGVEGGCRGCRGWVSRAVEGAQVCGLDVPKLQTMLYINAQSPSPRTFLKKLRQRILQNCTKVEPCHAKVFRQTMVQRNIRDCANVAHTPKHQTMLYINAQSPSPRMFLKNLRCRVLQNYTKIESCHAKVFRQTMVQRN